MSVAALDRAVVEERPRLVAIAYRMLGSMSDAEDVVQDAVIRARRAAPADLDSPAAYLTTVTTRLAIDHLRSARVRRETYVGPWLPEPVPDTLDGEGDRAELADSLSMAFLVVLEQLSPDERAVLLLHDVFGYSHAEAAELIGRTEGASRQLLRRARQRLRAERAVARTADAEHHARVLAAFVAACDGGELDDFLRLLTDDAVMISDGGASTKAARRPVVGSWRVGRLMAAVMGRHRDTRRFTTARVNGETAVVVFERGHLTGVAFVEATDDGRIRRIHWVRNPDKLVHVRDHVVAPV